MRKKFRRKPRVVLRSKLRKERARKFGIISGIIVATAFLILAMLFIRNTVSDFLHSETFIIKKISLACDDSGIDKEAVLSELKSLLMDKKIPIWSANYKKISSLIQQKYPRIKVMKFYPSSLGGIRVRIIGRTPVATILPSISEGLVKIPKSSKASSSSSSFDGKILAIDEEGICFPSCDQTEIQTLPLIKNISSGEENLARIISFIKIASSADNEFFKKIKTISLDNFMLRLGMNDGYDILWGDISEIPDDKKAASDSQQRKIFQIKTMSSRKVIKDALERYGKISYIDVSVLNSQTKNNRVICCITPN